MNTTGVNLKSDKTKQSIKKSDLPPIAPKANASGAAGPQTPQSSSTPTLKNNLKFQRYFEDNIILINPMVDCSDKELHQRNGFKSTGENLYTFFKNGDKATFVQNVFKPSKLGELTKDNFGTVKLINNVVRPPNFKNDPLADLGATT